MVHTSARTASASTWMPLLLAVFAGAAAGAGVMAWAGPGKPARKQPDARMRANVGRARRADSSFATETGDAVAHTTHAGASDARAVDDARLLARIHTTLRALCEDAQAVDVRLHGGVVELHGQVQRSEQRRLMRNLRQIYGVEEVRSFLRVYELHVHEQAEQLVVH